ncbi:MAG TPA: glycosyltransferase family 2 protein [Candidatus Polarisedimenticolia bacterium]|jgi:GT2 family glycosyltransferase|nr:glycosyltransferase family 2 protein [Candidatus Polarisedimenticolia bacterium]
MPTLGVVIVTRNRKEEVLDLVSTLAAMAREGGDEIVVVDNGSTDRTVALLQERHPALKILPMGVNRGAPAARNAAAAASLADVLIFLDDDVGIEDPGFFGKVRRIFAVESPPAVAAFRILDPATRRARSFEIPRRRKDLELEACETSYFISAGCAIRREIYAAVGGMDESLVYGFEELDFSYRAVSRGFRIFYHPEICVLHRMSDEGRPAWRRLYYFFRNKIWISARYLPWPMFFSHLVVWSGYFLRETLRIGRPDIYVRALAAGIAGLPRRLRARKTDRIPPEALERLRRIEGRLYY